MRYATFVYAQETQGTAVYDIKKHIKPDVMSQSQLTVRCGGKKGGYFELAEQKHDTNFSTGFKKEPYEMAPFWRRGGG